MLTKEKLHKVFTDICDDKVVLDVALDAYDAYLEKEAEKTGVKPGTDAYKRTVFALLFAMGVSSSVLAATPYDEVPEGCWAYDAVKKLADDGIIEGYPDGMFRGDELATRFEMAKAIKRAVVSNEKMHEKDRELLDKLAKEYAEELKGFNVRVVELERRVGNVRWQGSIGYRYIRDKSDAAAGGGGIMAMFGGGNDGPKRSSIQYLTARLEPDIKLGKNWTGHMRMNYHIDTASGKAGASDVISGSGNNSGGMMAMFGGGEPYGRKVKGFSIDRVYLQGDYKNFQAVIGKFPYSSVVDKGLVFNDNITGVQTTYGSKIKGKVTFGRVNSDPYHVNDNNNNGMMGMFGGGNGEVKRTYVGAEVFANPGKASVGVGYYHYKEKKDGNGGGVMALFGRGGAEPGRSADIVSAGIGYQFGKLFGLDAAGAWNLKEDMGYHGSKRSWQAAARFGQKDLKKTGSLSGYAAYRHLGNSVTWRPDYEVMASGQKGWEFGIDYIFAKNVRATLKYFTGKNIRDNTKAGTLFSEVICYF